MPVCARKLSVNWHCKMTQEKKKKKWKKCDMWYVYIQHLSFDHISNTVQKLSQQTFSWTVRLSYLRCRLFASVTAETFPSSTTNNCWDKVHTASGFERNPSTSSINDCQKWSNEHVVRKLVTFWTPFTVYCCTPPSCTYLDTIRNVTHHFPNCEFHT